ncbi:MAG: M23 family metallopeptidase [Pseudonocardiaceae bacterium]
MSARIASAAATYFPVPVLAIRTPLLLSSCGLRHTAAVPSGATPVHAGRIVNGDPANVRSFVGYGAEVIAAADRTVVQTSDSLPDQPPGTLPDPSTITVDTVDGNHVILDIGRGLYLFYAHLQPGSVAVEPGQQVTRGQALGKLGNSGNTSAPHLHVHVMNGTSVLGSDGRPYVIDRFGLAGQVAPQQFETSQNLTGSFGQGRTPPAERRDQFPLNLQIIDFPS